MVERRYTNAEKKEATEYVFEIVVGFLLLGGLVYGLVSCALGGNEEVSSSEDERFAQKVERASVDVQVKRQPVGISSSVYQPYTREGWPETFETWGDKGIKRIQDLREAAAETVASNPKCDYVDLSEISGNRSTPPNRPIVFVDCRNGERFYLSEADIGGNLSTEMEKGARFSSTALIQRCTEEVQGRLNLPKSFDRDWFSVSDRQGSSGNRVVEFSFEAKNRLGLTLPASARCIMTTEGAFEVEITE